MALRHVGPAVLCLLAVGCGGAGTTDLTRTQDSAEVETRDASSDAAAPLANFVKVREGLYRGGHPDAEGLDYLKALGVRRILNLEVGDFVEAFPWTIAAEKRNAEARGMQDIRYPMSAFEPAASDRFDRNMDEILALLDTATADDPIYVHCKHGQDRTGLVIGLERVFDEGWAPERAHDEMIRLGFHSFFLGLDEYFEEKTGWDD